MRTIRKLLERDQGIGEQEANRSKETREFQHICGEQGANRSKESGEFENIDQTARKGQTARQRLENWRTRSRPLERDSRF